jgi:surface protein
MPAALGSLISKDEYNAIHNSVDFVLGAGDGGENGYGRTLLSSSVSSGDIITSEHMLALYNDILKARKHQKGVNTSVAGFWSNSDGLNAPSDDEIVGVYAADVGANPANPNEVTSFYSSNDVNEGFKDFESAASDIVAGHDLVGPGQLTVEAYNSTRTSQWGGNDISSPGSSINYAFTVTWANADERRYFFNSGGFIQFGASAAGSWTSGTKNAVWKTMLSGSGLINFGKSATVATGTSPGTGSSVGNYYANWANTSSSNPVTIYTKNGSGVYSDNSLIIQAWQTATNSLRFNMIFQDGDLGTGGPAPDTPVDEFVTADITAGVGIYTATDTLGLPSPDVTVVSSLDGGVAGTSSLSIQALQPGTNTQITEINEGESVTFKLITSNVTTGTVIPWTITGIELDDVTLTALNGNFTVGSNETVTVTTIADEATEGVQSMSLNLPSNGGVSKSVTVNDTSANVDLILRRTYTEMPEGFTNNYWMASGQTEIDGEQFFWDILSPQSQQFVTTAGSFTYSASTTYSNTNPAFSVVTVTDSVINDTFNASVRLLRGGPDGQGGVVVDTKVVTINDVTDDAFEMTVDTNIRASGDALGEANDTTNTEFTIYLEGGNGDVADIEFQFIGITGTTTLSPALWYTVTSGASASYFDFSSSITTGGTFKFRARGKGRFRFGSHYTISGEDGGIDTTRLSLFNHGGKIVSVDNWGTEMEFTSFRNMFNNCELAEFTTTQNFRINSTQASDCRDMFAYSRIQDTNNAIDNWNMVGVTRVDRMFFSARDFGFNAPNKLSTWNTSTMTNMSEMFQYARYFEGDISNWNTSNVLDMKFMFGMYNGSLLYPPSTQGAFNADISNWDVGNVTSMDGMFFSSAAFNQDLSNWCVTNIISEPVSFTGGQSILSAANKPVWGTCPGTGPTTLNIPPGTYIGEPAPDVVASLSQVEFGDAGETVLPEVFFEMKMYVDGAPAAFPEFQGPSSVYVRNPAAGQFNAADKSRQYDLGDWNVNNGNPLDTTWTKVWEGDFWASEIKVVVTQVLAVGTPTVDTIDLWANPDNTGNISETSLYTDPTSLNTWFAVDGDDQPKLRFNLRDEAGAGASVLATREYEIEFWGRGQSRYRLSNQQLANESYLETKFASFRIRLNVQGESVDGFNFQN